MGEDRTEIESRLLTDPFDHDLRLDYARLLVESGEPAAAVEQFRIVFGGMPEDARPALELARCLLSLERSEEALEAYDRARERRGFETDDALEALAARRARAATGIQVIEGGASADVVELQSFRVEHDSVRFADISGMDELKRTLRLQIVEPFTRPGLFQRFKKKAGGGVLLYGPPGCGKTLIARAVATECKAGFVSVGISDVLNHWIGESERNLALLFDKARSERPCVLFFDELDALAYSRSKAISEHSRTVVNEFLSQLDGFGQDNEGVLVLAATNMPWDVDPAMKRPGRFSRQIFVPPPDAAAREAMLRLKLEDLPTEVVDPAAVARITEHYSGADIDGLIEMAKEIALVDIIDRHAERPLTQADLEQACEATAPSTLDWLRTARNLVRYAGADRAYKEVEKYLKGVKGL